MSVTVSVAAQKYGGDSVQPIGRTSGKARKRFFTFERRIRCCELGDIGEVQSDSVEAVGDIDLHQLCWSVRGIGCHDLCQDLFECLAKLHGFLRG